MKFTDEKLWKWFKDAQEDRIPQMTEKVFFPITNEVTGDAVAVYHFGEDGEPKIIVLMERADLEAEIERLTQVLAAID